MAAAVLDRFVSQELVWSDRDILTNPAPSDVASTSLDIFKSLSSSKSSRSKNSANQKRGIAGTTAFFPYV